MKDVGGAVLAGCSPPFLGRERAAVDVDVGPERRSPRYNETCLALESVEESGAAVLEPRGVWLRSLVEKIAKMRVNDDDVCCCIGERLKLEGETENMGV